MHSCNSSTQLGVKSSLLQMCLDARPTTIAGFAISNCPFFIWENGLSQLPEFCFRVYWRWCGKLLHFLLPTSVLHRGCSCVVRFASNSVKCARARDKPSYFLICTSTDCTFTSFARFRAQFATARQRLSEVVQSRSCFEGCAWERRLTQDLHDPM